MLLLVVGRAGEASVLLSAARSWKYLLAFRSARRNWQSALEEFATLAFAPSSPPLNCAYRIRAKGDTYPASLIIELLCRVGRALQSSTLFGLVLFSV